MESKTDLVSTFLASTCAVIIGLHQSWWPQNKAEGQPPALPDFTDDELEKVMVTMYLVAIGWSQWSGANVSRVGPYALMVFGVFVSVCAGALASAYPNQIYYVYAVRALQGFGSSSLAVAVPEYIMTSNSHTTGPFQSSMLCLIGVFIVLGELISHSLSLLMTWTHMNFVTTGIASLNMVTLILLHFTSRRYDDQMTVCHYHRTDSSVGPYSEFLEDTSENADQDKLETSASTYQQLADDDKRYKKKLRWCVFVCVALFVFRDFSCVPVFKKSVRSIFAELNVKHVTYEQCALLVTALQLVVTTSTVFLVEKYGRRKILLSSSIVMHLAATGLGLIIFNSNVVTSVRLRHVCIMCALVLYIIGFAQGIGSIPWAMPFNNIQQNVRSFTLGFIISAHFLFLLIAESWYIHEEQIYSAKSNFAYWLMFCCFWQTIFVYAFVMNIKS